MTGIIGIEYILPKDILTNKQLEKEYKSWTAEKIFEKTGIKSRYITDGKTTACDLGVLACEKLISNYNIDRREIDFIILITQSPDYILPTSACIMQERLGLVTNAGAFDINLGCSGFVYGLAVAKGLVDTGIAHNVLLVTSETYSKYINVKDKSTRTIFGDGAAATLVGNGGMRIGGFDLCTDGRGCDLLTVPAGGARMPFDQTTCKELIDDNDNVRSLENLYMDGTGIFEFTIREVPDSVYRIVKKEQLNMNEIDLFIFHQANKFMLDYLQRIMKIPKDRFFVDMTDIGNTVSASIPIALKRAIHSGLVHENQKILLSGFGVGLSWGSTVIYTEDL